MLLTYWTQHLYASPRGSCTMRRMCTTCAWNPGSKDQTEGRPVNVLNVLDNVGTSRSVDDATVVKLAARDPLACLLRACNAK